eukprot:TRINITY_DN2728_c0_g1_i1.p1 TRINITY_DN2728_c0_g1~~TRINITY_DN2728_c0_g1_i1.p1  ORF type:complete len:204 (+),score=24.11 TRINITY_DN2728_c0_g1_i1:192-803(+)
MASRPQSAKSFRTESSTIGSHSNKNKFANVKSRYSRPASAPSARQQNKTTNPNPKSGTSTALKIMRYNGDMFAVKHHHKLTGYKLSEQLGENVKGETTTTNMASYKKPQMPTIASRRKPLVPYQMNARRSQLPTQYPNEARKYIRHCAERNSSQLEIGDPNCNSITKSCSAVYFGVVPDAAVASSNPGIFASWTKRHRQARGV